MKQPERPDAGVSIGFIGLGAMGHPMAGRLVTAGYDVRIRDVSETAVAAFRTEFPAARDFDGEADVIILMLPNSAIVESVLFGDQGIAEKLAAGTLVIDMSSSEPLRTREVADRATALGLRFVDAPVSGGVRGAVAGQLAIMVGGTDDSVALATPVLTVLGSKIFHVGPSGAGHAAKALNNMVSAASVAVTAEALHVGEAFGIDPSLLNSVLNASSGRSNTSENKVEQFMLSGTFGSGFALVLMAKDVKIAVDLASQLDERTPIGDATSTLWSRAAAELPPGTDHTRMYDFLG